MLIFREGSYKIDKLLEEVFHNVKKQLLVYYDAVAQAAVSTRTN